jgi:hypothetical protein
MYLTLQSAQQTLNDSYNRTLDVLAMSIGGAPIHGGLAMKEKWKKINSLNNYYSVSTLGRVRSEKRIVISKKGIKMNFTSKILKHRVNEKGYCIVYPKINNCKKALQVHRLVAKEFIINKLSKPCVNHKDFNRANNCLDNLEWVTHKENTQYSIMNGRKHGPTRAIDLFRCQF